MAVSRTRRRLVVATCLLAVVLAALAGGWVYDRLTLSAAERNLVGTWAQSRDGNANLGVVVEFTLRDDRSVKLVNRDAKTGAVTYAREEYDRWDVTDGVLTMRRRPEVPQSRWWYAWWGRSNRVGSYDVLRLAPDGPDRIRWENLVFSGPVDSPWRMATWNRVKAE